MTVEAVVPEHEISSVNCSATPTATSSTATKTKQETHWTDAQVRWTAANHNQEQSDHNNADDEEDDEDSRSSSSFQPDPTQTFSHRFSFREKTIDINLRGYEEQSDTIYISTGLTLWRSSELLCEYMIGHGIQRIENMKKTQDEKRGARMLELGSGLGLAGILAYRLLSEMSLSQASLEQEEVQNTIVLTDGDTNALSVLRQNVECNTSPPVSTPIFVEQLLWGKATANSFLQQRQHNGRTFDFILAADAIYVLANVAPLLETVQTLLQRPHGEFWFSYCRRRQVSVQIDDVLQAANEIGLFHELVMEDGDILVYVVRWKQDV